MYKIVFSPTGYGLKAKSLDDYNFALSKETREILISGDVDSENTVQDMVEVTYTPAVYETVEDVVVEDITQNNDIKTFESVDESIATVNQNGQVERVSDGSVQITVKGQYLIKGIDVSVSRSEEVSHTSFDRWANNSLSKEITDAIDDRIAGKDASAKEIFSTQNHDGQNYVRSTGCWAYGLDLTCISPWNSTGGTTRAGTLISPRHIVFAKHYQIGTGATVRFIQSDGTVINRAMTAKQSIGDSSCDLCIGVLDSDVPAGISFAKILPANWVNYVPNIDKRVPALLLDQQEKALIGDVTVAYTGISFGFRYPVDSQRLIFSEELIGGDSGNPAFFVIDDELVILTTWWRGGAGSGSNILYYKTEINSAMTSLGGGYQLTEADLTSFTSFA